MNNVAITGCGVSLPNQRIKSSDLLSELQSEKRFGVSHYWMEENMGVLERRLAPMGSMPSEGATKACDKALKEASVSPKDVDMLIFCGIEKDRNEPATAFTIANNLGMEPKKCFDIMNACYGFCEGLEAAANCIRLGIVETALVCSAEVNRRVIDLLMRDLASPGITKPEFRSGLGFLSAGDAAGALVLSRSETSGLTHFNTVTDAHAQKYCSYTLRDGLLHASMDMPKVVLTAKRLLADLVPESMALFDWHQSDFVISHQAGQRTHDVINSFGVARASKNVKTFDTLGNMTSVTMPVVFERAKRQAQRGDKIFCVFAGSGIVCGCFGITMH